MEKEGNINFHTSKIQNKFINEFTYNGERLILELVEIQVYIVMKNFLLALIVLLWD